MRFMMQGIARRSVVFVLWGLIDFQLVLAFDTVIEVESYFRRLRTSPESAFIYIFALASGGVSFGFW